MPEFAVIARPYRRLSPQEQAVGASATRINVGRRKMIDCICEKPKAYLISAADAEGAMNLVQRLAAGAGMELIVHRAIEVSRALPGVETPLKRPARR